MSLMDIIKGMPNGAEALQNNFLFGSIVASNLNESSPVNGYYVRFGNGLQVCFSEFPANVDITNDVSNNSKKFAAEFIDHPWVSYSLKEPTNFRVYEFTDNVYLGVSISDQEWRLRTRSGTSTSASGVALIAVGRWK